ncbi:general secretion pathway protein GspB [Thiohalomonas denitrificans]|uniref:general secretion pathway protein GspB n=1 Tax=Thiohalomonas denitrificans TaxID=415747 RepID=UPI0026EEF878|nr:general secretion pathway protein GspB [Thiohalomonas denitrificans]
MSYILEALNKSQREHARGSVPTLQGQAPPARPSVRRIGPLVSALLLGAVMSLSIAGYLVRWQDSGTVALSSLSASGSGVIRSGSSGSDSQPVRTVEHPAVPVRKPEPLPVAGTVPARPLEQKAGQHGNLEPPVAERPEPVRQPPAKAWSELPVDIRRTIGNLVLNIHVYSERPEKRFVFINQRQYGEGDVLKEGPTLEVINPAGLVLAFREERFRIDM